MNAVEKNVLTSSFLGDNFLLDTSVSRRLFHGNAEMLPVIDYRSRLNPASIAENRPFTDITELWLNADGRKQAVMRQCGVDQKFLAEGDASSWEKFLAWSKLLPDLCGHPLYVLSHLELKRVFGNETPLSEATAKAVYEACNLQLSHDALTPRGLLKTYRVEALCTTDDPIDDLRHHQTLKKAWADVAILPTWCPERAMHIGQPGFAEYVESLERVVGMDIRHFNDLADALQKRHDFFAENGCVLSDYGAYVAYTEPYTDSQVETIFEKSMRGQQLPALEVRQFRHAFLRRSVEMDKQEGWVQLHAPANDDMRSLLYRSMQQGALRRFVGVAAYSESFMGFSVHETFRRLLCAVLGQAVGEGTLPEDDVLLGELMEKVAYGNARNSLQLPVAAR